MGFLTYLKLS